MNPAGAIGVTGVILAGGRNRRMGGRMKALLQLDGQLFIERQLAELSQLCNEIIIVANEPELFEPQLSWPYAQVRIVQDEQPGKGPLAGLQAAMLAANSEELWVVACDMPYACAAAAKVLIDLRRHQRQGEDEGKGQCSGGFDLALPLIAGRLQPLHGIYHRRCLPAVERLLGEQSYRIMALIKQLNGVNAEDHFFVERGISLKFVHNVNDPTDFSKL